MGIQMDREFVASDISVASLMSLSFIHSDGVMYASAGRVLTQRILLLETDPTFGGALEQQVAHLERLQELGLLTDRTKVGRPRQWRLKDSVVTTVLRTDIQCDVCSLIKAINPDFDTKLAVFDSMTQTGSWGFICVEHFVSEGCWLGVGRGQLLRPEHRPTRKLTYAE